MRANPGPMCSSACLRRVALRALVRAALLAMAPLTAQQGVVALEYGVEARDPYTGGVPAHVATARYVSLGPFPLGTNHDSGDVQRLLPDERLCWIETPHFRIGCALPPVEVRGSREWKARLAGELQVLAARLPGIDPKSKRLDRWLRAHLVAQRAEQLYADVVALLGCTADSFPADAGEQAPGPGFRGVGPYLGMRQKFTILLLARGANQAAYTEAHHAFASTEPVRLQDARFGALVFVAAGDCGAGIGDDEEALAALLTYHLAFNLYTGYRSFGHHLPAWLPHGLALWHGRAVSAAVPLIDVRNDADREAWRRWDQRLAALRKDWAFRPLDDLFARIEPGSLDADDALQCWALLQWLLAERRQEFVRLFERMKDPFHGRLRFPTQAELLARQAEALQQAFGADTAGLEQQWRAGSSIAKGTRRRSR